MRRALVVAALMLGVVAPAAVSDALADACPPDAADRAAKLRARLDRERAKATRWRIGWAAGFTVLAGGQLALLLTETAPFGDFDDPARASLRAGTAKAVVGAASRALPGIKIPRLAVTGDACADLAAAEAALAMAAKTERKTFWLGHVGNLLVHGAGAVYVGLAADDAWDEAALSFGIGYAIGIAATYTQPRGASKEHRREPDARTWHVAPLVTPRTRGVAVAWSF